MKMASGSKALNRALFVLAALRLPRREVDELRKVISEWSADEFYYILKDLDTTLSTNPVMQDLLLELPLSSREDPIVDQLLRELNEIRTNELRVSVPEFARRLREIGLRQDPPVNLAPFDPRRGFRSWLATLVADLSPSRAYQLVAMLREGQGKQTQRSWPLNRS